MFWFSDPQTHFLWHSVLLFSSVFYENYQCNTINHLAAGTRKSFLETWVDVQFRNNHLLTVLHEISDTSFDEPETHPHCFALMISEIEMFSICFFNRPHHVYNLVLWEWCVAFFWWKRKGKIKEKLPFYCLRVVHFLSINNAK